MSRSATSTYRNGDRDPEWPAGFYWSEAYERPVFRTCNACSGKCALPLGHEGEHRDKDGWPARWSDPTYLGDGPWGA